MGWDDCGCSAPIQPHPALPAQHASHSRESPFCSLPHPLRCGREMPSAVNHPALLSSPCFVRLPWCLRAGCCAGPPTHPHTPGSALAAGPGGCRGEILAVPVPKSVCGRTCFPKPSPNPALPHLGRRGGGHRLLQGCSARTVGTLGHAWGFWDGVPWLYLRVRSLFQAWQLMGSSRKLW